MPKALAKSRTLLDIIKDEGTETAYKDLADRYAQTKCRKSIKDRLHLRRSKSASCTPSSQTMPTSDVPLSDVPFNRRSNRMQSSQEEEKTDSDGSVSVSVNRKFQRFQSSSLRVRDIPIPDEEKHDDDQEESDSNVVSASSSRKFNRLQSSRSIRRHTNSEGGESNDEDNEEDEEEEEDDEDEDEDEYEDEDEEDEEEDEDNKETTNESEGEAPRMMSLFDLLADDGEGGGRGYLDGEDDEDEGAGEEEEEEEENEDGVEHVCCVCMVRHKGAAFIPCGHTFCRLCSRELWVSRGNCPLCNGYILEILDIF